MSGDLSLLTFFTFQKYSPTMLLYSFRFVINIRFQFSLIQKKVSKTFQNLDCKHFSQDDKNLQCVEKYHKGLFPII